MTIVLTAGERHEQTVFEPLMEQGAVKRSLRGRPRIRPDRVVGDKGYSSRRVRTYLHRRGIKAVIPRRMDQHPRKDFDKDAYRERNCVERAINRLKQWRRVATRYEKTVASYAAMVTIATIRMWL
jgi:transposase